MKLKRQLKQIVAFTVLAASITTTGCTALPWRKKKQVAQQTVKEQYIQQAASNINYDTEVDMSKDYQPSPQATSSYSRPSKSYSSPSSGGGGSCCH